MKTVLALLALLPALFLHSGSVSAAPAGGQLILHPTRVVFEGDTRSAQLELINPSTEAATYRLRTVNRHMGERGEMVEILEQGAGDKFADSMLVYSPRQVTLGPGASQVVRVMVRKPADLPAGEYRSHLLFERIAGAVAGPIRVSTQPAHQAMQIELIPLVSISIPVIVRQGPTAAKVVIGGLSYARNARTLTVLVERTGTESVYGDVRVHFQPVGGQMIELAAQNGVAIYTPNAKRYLAIPLPFRPGLDPTGGRIEVHFQQRPEAGAKSLAAAYITLK
ncbi:MAG TPA: molecular chaperone [Verrucomicrobiae bacterium]|nr:molecular chaperone [Verrucomicrobiae bacterium]